MKPDTNAETLRESVRAKYAQRAVAVISGAGAAGCGDTACGAVSLDLYTGEEASLLPTEALEASLGCGNPAALAELVPGEVVLDLGSGGGIDVLLSAGRVGPNGFVYGLDMTDEMLALAEQNRVKQGATNVSFLKGHIEQVPLPDEAVDVVISNCVINLSADKAQVLREAFRVLKPGGRFAVSDVVVQGEMATELRANMEAWVGCVAGALAEAEYRQLLSDAGFRNVEIEVTRIYGPSELAQQAGCSANTSAAGRVVSAFVRASKPGEVGEPAETSRRHPSAPVLARRRAAWLTPVAGRPKNQH